MFVGASDEEKELSREESSGVGWSFNPLAAVSAMKNIFTSPMTKTLAASGALGPQAALVARADMMARGVKAAAKGPQKAAPAPSAAAPATEESSASPARAASASPARAASATVGGWTHNDDQITALIHRERDPEKRQRMIMNHERAKRMRSVTAGTGVSEVEEAIGELYARVPVNPQGKPFLDASAVKALTMHMASKSAGGATKNGAIRARKLIAQYAQMNNISTPGLKVVRR